MCIPFTLEKSSGMSANNNFFLPKIQSKLKHKKGIYQNHTYHTILIFIKKIVGMEHLFLCTETRGGGGQKELVAKEPNY